MDIRQDGQLLGDFLEADAPIAVTIKSRRSMPPHSGLSDIVWTFHIAVRGGEFALARLRDLCGGRLFNRLDIGPTALELDVRNVRFGSKADICTAIGHVRFTPESGHVRCN
jgi:hypothetical protein